MKITVVGPAYPLRGGIAHHVYCLKQELSSRRHEVQVLSFKTLYPRILFPGTTTLDPSQLKLDPGALPVLHPLNPLTWSEAAKEARQFAPDAVVFEWWNPFFSPVIGSLARRFKKNGWNTVLECHNVFPHERNLLDRPLIRFAFDPMDNFITHSVRDQQDVLTLFPGRRVRVASLPRMTEFAKERQRSHPLPTLLFFGIVRKYKGLEVLIRAMPMVLSKLKCQLIIAGEFYEPVSRYEKLIRECGIEPHVRMENRYVPNEEVSELFSQADVLVLPYLSASQSAIAQIAFANRLPVIASRVGGLPDVVIERVNGLLVPPHSPQALAHAVISFFTDNLREIFVKNISSSNQPDFVEVGKVIEEIAGHN